MDEEKVTMEGTIMECGVPNGNKRVYDTEAIQESDSRVYATEHGIFAHIELDDRWYDDSWYKLSNVPLVAEAKIKIEPIVEELAEKLVTQYDLINKEDKDEIK